MTDEYIELLTLVFDKLYLNDGITRDNPNGYDPYYHCNGRFPSDINIKIETMYKFINEEIYIIFYPRRIHKKKYFKYLISIKTKEQALANYPYVDNFIAKDNYVLPPDICRLPPKHIFANKQFINFGNKQFIWIDYKEINHYREFIKYYDLYNDQYNDAPAEEKKIIVNSSQPENSNDQHNDVLAKGKKIIVNSSQPENSNKIIDVNDTICEISIQNTDIEQPKTFILDYKGGAMRAVGPAEYSVTITIGTNGYKISTYEQDMHISTDCVLFKNIQTLSIIRTDHTEKYKYIQICCFTMEKPFHETHHLIGMSKNIEYVYNLIMEGYKAACFDKDKILGITF
jgi:hypothetical protein